MQQVNFLWTISKFGPDVTYIYMCTVVVQHLNINKMAKILNLIQAVSISASFNKVRARLQCTRNVLVFCLLQIA